MPDTPFDEIVRITWNMEQPERGLVSLINSTRDLDKALVKNAEQSSTWSLRFQQNIGQIHAGFVSLMQDIGAMEFAMAKMTVQAGPGATAGNRAAATYGGVAPGAVAMGVSASYLRPANSDIPQEKWDWAVNQILKGQPSLYPYSASMQLGAFGGGLPVIPGVRGPGGGETGAGTSDAAQNAAAAAQARVVELAGMRANIARQDYDAYVKLSRLEQAVLASHEAQVAAFLTGPSLATQREQGMGRLMAQYRQHPADITGNAAAVASGTQFDEQQRANARINYDARRQIDLDLDQRFMRQMQSQIPSDMDAQTQAYWAGQVNRNAAIQAQPLSTQGLTGPGLQVALQQQLAQAQQQLQQAVQAAQLAQAGGGIGLGGARTGGTAGSAIAAALGGVPGAASPAAQAAVQTAAQRVQNLQQQMATLNQTQAAGARTTNQSTDAFSRHILSIVRTIAIYQALHMAVQTARQAIEQATLVQATSARAGFISGQDESFTDREFMRAAQYGVAPSEAGPGIIASAQTGANIQDRERARQAALVFGADQYVNAIQEIQQTELRANAAGISHVDTMNFLAEAYTRVPLSMEEYFDALQFGIELQNTLGLSAEQAGLAILNITKATEQSPTQVANILERVRIRLDPQTAIGEDTREKLKPFGIAPGTTDEMFRSIAEKVATLSRAGQTDAAEEILNALVGGLAGPQTLRELRVVFVALFDTFAKGQESLANWSTLVKDVGETGDTAFKKLKASWDLLLASLANLQPITDAANYLATKFNAKATINNELPDYQALSDADRKLAIEAFKLKTGVGVTEEQTWDWKAIPGSTDFQRTGATFPRVEITDDMLRERGIGVNNLLTPPWERAENNIRKIDLEEELTAKFLLFVDQFLGQISGVPVDMGGRNPTEWGATRPNLNPSVKSRLTVPEPPSFGGFQDLPEGLNWEKFTSDIKTYTAQIQADVPGYKINPQQVAFWDATYGHYRRVTGDSEAIRRALQEQTETLKEIQGVFNVPAGGEVMVPFFAIQSGFYPSNRVPGGGGLGHSPGGGGLLDDPDESRDRPAGGRLGNLTSRRGTGRTIPPFDPGVASSGLLAGEGDAVAIRRAAQQLARRNDRGVASIGLLGGENYEERSRVNREDAVHREVARNRATPGPARQWGFENNIRPTGQAAPVSATIPVTIHTRNMIVVNGKLIYDEMLHQMQRELSGQRRGFGGGSGSAYMVS